MSATDADTKNRDESIEAASHVDEKAGGQEEEIPSSGPSPTPEMSASPSGAPVLSDKSATIFGSAERDATPVDKVWLEDALAGTGLSLDSKILSWFATNCPNQKSLRILLEDPQGDTELSTVGIPLVARRAIKSKLNVQKMSDVDKSFDEVLVIPLPLHGHKSAPPATIDEESFVVKRGKKEFWGPFFWLATAKSYLS
eukprot:gb/GEZN01011571.1/.p2 GENE.gb/GEZN01011571.1/~~gb/GEZN01011571.1/.p2  ORF type:complete len:198 (-),score=32.59 gb/GEZN01011571.1/:509-1102(-)